jgi:hypothetical protein
MPSSHVKEGVMHHKILGVTMVAGLLCAGCLDGPVCLNPLAAEEDRSKLPGVAGTWTDCDESSTRLTFGEAEEDRFELLLTEGDEEPAESLLVSFTLSTGSISGRPSASPFSPGISSGAASAMRASSTRQWPWR